MFVEGLYNFIMFLKNQGQSQWFSPEEIMAALNRGQIDKYNSEYKHFEKTQEITDSFRPFQKAAQVDFADDKWALPGDYFHATNISSLIDTIENEGEEDETTITTEYKGKLYTVGEWLDAKQSTLLPPDIYHIKSRVINGELEVVPVTGVLKVRLYYLKSFVDAVFAYDMNDNKITFKEQGSKDPEWPQLEHNDLVWRTLKYLGIPLHDEMFIQAESFLKEPVTT